MNHIDNKTANYQFYKLAAIIGFISVIVAVIFAWNAPATGYESSIYLSTPFVSWVLLFIGFALGVTIVLSKTGEKDKGDSSWLIGLLLICFVNIVILSLPWVRNYFFLDGSGDTGSHLGWVQDLLASGHVAADNIYPIMHIFLAQISLVLRIAPMSLFIWGLLLFVPLSFVSVYLICRELLSNKRQIAIATLAGCILFVNWSPALAPNVMGNLLFPFILFIVIKVMKTTIQTFQWTTCLILLVLFFVPLHPVPAMALLLIVITVWLWHKVKSGDRNKKPVSHRILGVPLILLITVWLFLWISSFGIWDNTLRNLYTLVTEGGQTPAQSTLNQAVYAMQYGYNVLVQITKIYGSFIVYAFLAVLGFIILQRQKLKNKDSYLLTPIAWATLMVGLIMVALYFANFVFSPLRLLVFLIFLCPPFVGIALGSFIDYPPWPSWSRSARVICVGLILMVLSIASVLILYPSQYTLSLSVQNTRSEITGMDWFFNNKDVSIVSAGWYYDPSIYSSYLLTSEQRADRNDLSVYVTQSFPYNLGYSKNKELGQSYQNDVYLVMTALTREVYINVFPKMASQRLTTDNLNQLENDPSVDKLYSTNKGFDIYYVHAIQ